MTRSVDRSHEHARFRRLGNQADRWALASESEAANDLYAAAASHGTKTFHDLTADVFSGKLSGWDAVWVARLGRVLALRGADHELQDFAFRALQLTVPTLPIAPNTFKYRKLYFELLYQKRSMEEAKRFLEINTDLREFYYGYLNCDLINPFISTKHVRVEEWLNSFNKPFVATGHLPVQVALESTTPFDGLYVEGVEARTDGPMVSVMLTTFNPDPVEISTSVNSILAQSWTNLEVLLLDDCSDNDSSGVLETIAKSDPRIRLLRLPVNGGTYRARNVGIQHAHGKYVTGQDTDDWSHPERIARQVEYLEAHPEVPGVTITANRTDNNLVRTAVGQNPNRRCEVSLMTLVDTAKAIGGYLPLRKAADSEFRERIDAWSGKVVSNLPDPLYITRMSPGSLSRGDFRPGWTHPSRLAFRSSFMYWHQFGSKESLNLRSDPPVMTDIVPPHIAGGHNSERRDFDLCIVSDWRSSAPQHRAAVDELRALSQSQFSIAILQLDTPWGEIADRRTLTATVQELINSGRITRVFPDEEIHTELILVRDPAVLDYGPTLQTAITANRVLMIACGNPSSHPEEMQPYNVANAHEMGRNFFSQEPVWTVPEDSDLATFLSSSDLPFYPHKYPIYIDGNRYSGVRMHRRNNIPVLGRAAENDVNEWPISRELVSAYPVDGSVDLRILGDVRGAARTLRDSRAVDRWISYQIGEMDPSKYWRTLDAVILFDRKTVGGTIERSILEAFCAGTPVITDSRRAQLYGDAVVAAQPSTALAELHRIFSAPSERMRLRDSQLEFLKRFENPTRLLEYFTRCLVNSRKGTT